MAADAVRYFLLREIPSTEDGDFTYEKFIERYNADLAKGLGNLVSRTLTLAEKFKIKEAKSSPAIVESFFNIPKEKYDKALKDFKFNEGLIAIWEIIGKLDKYIDKEEPWKGGEKAIQVISNSLFILEEIAKLLQPFLPGTSEIILKQLKIKKSEILFPIKK